MRQGLALILEAKPDPLPAAGDEMKTGRQDAGRLAARVRYPPRVPRVFLASAAASGYGDAPGGLPRTFVLIEYCLYQLYGIAMSPDLRVASDARQNNK